MYGRFRKPMEITAPGAGKDHTGKRQLFFGMSGRNSSAFGTAHTALREGQMVSLHDRK